MRDCVTALLLLMSGKSWLFRGLVYTSIENSEYFTGELKLGCLREETSLLRALILT